MPKDMIARYIWVIDVLNRYKKLTREEINQLWMKSYLSDGDPMPERTFYHYRRMIEENFRIEIKCDSSGRYYIEKEESGNNKSVRDWVLDSYVLSNALKGTTIPTDRIEIEEIPSAREFLPLVLEAIEESRKIVFSYGGFNRSRVESGILFSPFFLKLYKQRWYMIGLKEKGKSVRTYALDRVTSMHISEESFELSPAVSLQELFGNIIGVSTSQAEVKTVRLKVSPMQSKYLRALPLHSSQQEEVNEDYSIFTYRLKLNFELVHEILSYGDAVKVLAPPELKAMVVTQLKETLRLYEAPDESKKTLI